MGHPKTFSCVVNWKNRVYAGSDNEDLIYLDNELTTDNGIPISARIVTGSITFNNSTSDYLGLLYNGLLNATGQFTQRIYIDGSQVASEDITAEELVDARLMSLTNGAPIGGGNVGEQGIGIGSGAPTGYSFRYPWEFLHVGESLQFEWEIFDEGSSLELRKFTLTAETDGVTELDSQ